MKVKKGRGRSFLVVALVTGLVFGTVGPSSAVAEAQGVHGTTSQVITKDQLKDTPPSPGEYDVDMSMQGEAKDGAYNAYFLKNAIQTVKIDVDEKNLNYLFQNAEKKPTVMTDKVTIGNKSVGYAGLKTKGNYTLKETNNSDSDRFSLTVNFGKYIKKKKGYAATQNFYGCNKISFNNFFFDKTMMKEYCALKLMTEMGVPTPQYGLAKLYINNEYYGVYFMLEAMDSSILEQYLKQGSDEISDYLAKPEKTKLHYDAGLDIYKDAGKFTMDSLAAALYKNENGEYTVKEDTFVAEQSGLWENDTDTLQDVAKMIPTVLTWEEKLNLLSAGKDFSGQTMDVNSSKYVQLLEEIMDVDETIRYFATHSFIIQMDNMFDEQQNFGLYVDKNGRSLLLPWDYDLGWGCFYAPCTAEDVANWDVDKMFSPDRVRGSASTVYPDYPLFYVIYQNQSLMDKYHQYMKDCSKITTLGGKTSSGVTYEAGRFAAAMDVLISKLETAASEKLANHVYYMDSGKEQDSYRACNQPSALLVGLPNLSKVIARRAVGVYAQLEGISTTVTGYDCDMTTIGNAQNWRASTGGNLTIVDDQTGIFATAEYEQDRPFAGPFVGSSVGPSLAVSKLNSGDALFRTIKSKLGCKSDANMAVYYMTDTKTPTSSYRVYVPVAQSMAAKDTSLYAYSEKNGTVQKLKTTVKDNLYSAETSSIQYIVVASGVQQGQTVVKDPEKNDKTGNTTVTKPAKVKSLKAKNVKKKKVTLTWKKVSGAKGYQIQYSLKKKFPSKKTTKKTTTKRKLTIKKLKKKKTYYFRVRAYKKKANGSKVYGKWSKVAKVKIRK